MVLAVSKTSGNVCPVTSAVRSIFVVKQQHLMLEVFLAGSGATGDGGVIEMVLDRHNLHELLFHDELTC